MAEALARLIASLLRRAFSTKWKSEGKRWRFKRNQSEQAGKLDTNSLLNDQLWLVRQLKDVRW